MTLKHIEGWELGAIPPNVISNSGALGTTSPTARTGGYRWGGSNDSITYDVDAVTGTEFWFGCALYTDDTSPGTTIAQPAVRLQDAASNEIMSIRSDANNIGANKARIYGAGANIQTIDFDWGPAWRYVEIRVVIGNSPDGEIEIWQDGVQIYLNTACDTQPGAATGLGRVTHTAGNNSSLWVDDIYVVDEDAVGRTGRLGAPRVFPLMPDADGNYGAWTPNNGGADYVEIDETPPDNATTIVSSAVLNDKVSVAVGNLPGTVTDVFGLKLVTTAQRTAGDPRGITPFLRVSATDYAIDEQLLAEGFATFFDYVEDDPATGVQWTAAGVNGIEVGVEVTT